MPLRLAKYGVPLAETAPAGLAAAGIEPMLLPRHPGRTTTAASELHEQAPREEPSRHGRSRYAEGSPWFASLPGPRAPEEVTPVSVERADQLHSAVAAALRHPRATVKLSVSTQKCQDAADQRQDEQDEAKGTQASAQEATGPVQQADGPRPTTVDRYYQAWAEYHAREGREPTDNELSQFLAARSMTGRGGRAISPSTLRRYLPDFRIYTAWDEHLHRHGSEPTADQLSRYLADSGSTGKPYSAEKIAEMVGGFPRRRAAIGPGGKTPTAF
ncbi:hypothetical protein ACFWOD_35960, partial [Streptomyces sp. NPDC058434]